MSAPTDNAPTPAADTPAATATEPTTGKRVRILVIGVVSTIVFFAADRWKDATFVKGTSELVDRVSNTVWVVSLAVTGVAFLRNLAGPASGGTAAPGKTGTTAARVSPPGTSRAPRRLAGLMLLPAPLLYPVTIIVVMLYAVLLSPLTSTTAPPPTGGSAPVPTPAPTPATHHAATSPAQLPAPPLTTSAPAHTAPRGTGRGAPSTTPAPQPVVVPPAGSPPPNLSGPYRMDYTPRNFGTVDRTIEFYTDLTPTGDAQCVAAGLAAPAVPGAVGPCYSALWYSDPGRQHLASGSRTYFRSEKAGREFRLHGAQPGSTDGTQDYTGRLTATNPTTYTGDMVSDNANRDHATYTLVAL